MGDQSLDYLLQQLLNDGNARFFESTIAEQLDDLTNGVREHFALFVIPIEYIDFLLTPHVITAGQLFDEFCFFYRFVFVFVFVLWHNYVGLVFICKVH